MTGNVCGLNLLLKVIVLKYVSKKFCFVLFCSYVWTELKGCCFPMFLWVFFFNIDEIDTSV